ncbi:PTS IIA-like nitrogen regulatory protein PtsN [Isoalcanivorax beigongshangi]|uniref:PTS IIA-like nitrogen regulatory protein PtsN n=1 Tax=Isoalcanivorax beigongshangi TaxID=3238810 RepID=A0ABV4AJ41_9GAMM
MRVRELLTPERTHYRLQGGSKKRLLDQVAQLASRDNPDLDEQQVFDALIARERLGSTGIGEGIAIPHCRLPHCTTATGMLISLEEAVDFDAVDGRPVDLVFVLLVPEDNPEQHLKTLSHLAALFNEQAYRDGLRAADSGDALYRAAVDSDIELAITS